MFLRSRREQADVFLREQYNVVEFAGETYIEGLPDMGLRLVEGVNTGLGGAEVINGIRVFDTPPYGSRLGSAQ